MADNNFISPGSVLSQINGFGSVSYPGNERLNAGDSASKQTNTNVTANETNLNSESTKGINDINNSADPNKPTVAEQLKKPDLTQPELPQSKPVPELKVEEENVFVQIGDKIGQELSDAKDWLKQQFKEAIKKGLEKGIDYGISKLSQPEGAEKPPINRENITTTKGSVGRVPALEDNRPKPNVPNAKLNTPRAQKYNSPPKISAPKINMPRFR